MFLFSRHHLYLLMCVCVLSMGVASVVQPIEGVFHVATVQRCPDESVHTIRQQAAGQQLSLVLYYVSWCSRSRAVRTIYEKLAELYGDQAYFATIDCWHLACNCSREYSSATATGGGPDVIALHKWPTLVVRHSSHITLQYHGEWNGPALTRFLDALLRPVVRLHDGSELRSLLMRTDAVVLGLFSHVNSYQYAKFVMAGVKWLETDPERTYRFAVALGASTARAVLNHARSNLPLVALINSNGVELFPGSPKWNASQIVRWTQMELERALSHVHGYSTPTSLAMQIRSGPVLALFAHDPSHTNGLDFYRSMYQTVNSNEVYSAEHSRCARVCWQQLETVKSPQRLGGCHWGTLEEPSVCYRRQQLNQLSFRDYYALNAMWNSAMTNCTHPSASVEIERLLMTHRRKHCLQSTQYNTPELKTMIVKFLKKSADLLRLHSAPGHNHTLAVVLLDGTQYKDALEALGIRYDAQLTAATAFIVDRHKESLFVMPERFSYERLMRFVAHYYEGYLYTPHQAVSDYRPTPTASTTIRLPNYNRQMFVDIVQQQNATLIVLLYSPECAFSALMSHTVLQLASILSATDIRFVRLNTKTNDLPWEFVMPVTPTLIVFPRGRAPASKVFPAYLPISVRNLFGFILAQLDPLEQVMVVLQSCRLKNRPHRNTQQHHQSCLRFAKSLLADHISQHLKLWQTFTDERHAILARLKTFKDISLDIQSNFKL